MRVHRLSICANLRRKPRRGFGGAFEALITSLPPVKGVTSTTEVIRGVDGNPIKLFIHRPAGANGPVPGMLHLHGGGMVIGAAADAQYVRWRDELAAVGMVVVGVEFRNGAGKLGSHPFPAGLNDCTSALQWVTDNKARLGISKLIVSGESGGGNLTTGDDAEGETRRPHRADRRRVRAVPLHLRRVRAETARADVAARERRLLHRLRD